MMKKSIQNTSNIKIAFILFLLCIIPLFVQRSLCATTTLQNTISNDVENYYNSIKNKVDNVDIFYYFVDFL